MWVLGIKLLFLVSCGKCCAISIDPHLEFLIWTLALLHKQKQFELSLPVFVTPFIISRVLFSLYIHLFDRTPFV